LAVIAFGRFHVVKEHSPTDWCRIKEQKIE
jgi:hypothetical protein